MAVTSVTINAINTQRVGIAFTVKGTFTTNDAAPTAQYSDETNPAQPAVLVIGGPLAYTWSFVHPGYAASATHALTVELEGGVSARSNTFDVVEN